ncbi:MAG: hypothetical protein ACOX4H_01400 [Bacillota bacterium]|nr:hypothetical protein [Clostridia bacterium]
MNNKEKSPRTNIFKITKDQWPFIFKLLVIAFVGIIILNFASLFNGPQTGNIQEKNIVDTGTETAHLSDEITLEKKLEKILSEMEGVGNTSVSIVYEEGPTKEYAVNVSTTAKEIEEKDQSGGVRTTNEKTETGQMVMVNGNSEPVLIKESMPKIQGVLIVAEGVNNPVVKERVFKAAQTLLQVPAHRITICTKNGG